MSNSVKESGNSKSKATLLIMLGWLVYAMSYLFALTYKFFID